MTGRYEGCLLWLEAVYAFLEAEFSLWIEKCYKASKLFVTWPTVVKMVWPSNVGKVNVNVRSVS